MATKPIYIDAEIKNNFKSCASKQGLTLKQAVEEALLRDMVRANFDIDINIRNNTKSKQLKILKVVK